MKIQKDTMGQLYVQWQIGEGGFKRAWIQRRSEDKDWARTPERRYLNVVRTDNLESGPGGNATDFPIYNDLPDEQILRAFVYSVSSLTGCKIPEEN